ncbi:MAG: hypothetical protein BMS9Abin15_0272 [Gammaproteobacteria bacterium]|nr:MAG: hypothetical protein BMS9Abin15_0272 [Gammaproteobacteria bacterium]
MCPDRTQIADSVDKFMFNNELFECIHGKINTITFTNGQDLFLVELHLRVEAYRLTRSGPL